MKIRLGFVPNSSSSSFVVVFPRKPKSFEDVFGFLFGKAEYDWTLNNGYNKEKVISYKEVAEIVFKDLKKKSTRKEIINLLCQRYYYGERHGFYLRHSLYWGLDQKLLDELEKLHIENNQKEKEYRDKLKQMLDLNILPVPYASKDALDKNKKPLYTPSQIAAYNQYYKDMSSFMKTNKDYIKLQKESFKFYSFNSPVFKKVRDLETKLATKDYNLLKKNSKEKSSKSHLAILEYSDNDGSFGDIMEHGGIFDKLEKIQISHH